MDNDIINKNWNSKNWNDWVKRYINIFKTNDYFGFYVHADRMINNLVKDIRANPTKNKIINLIKAIKKLWATFIIEPEINNLSEKLFNNWNKILSEIDKGNIEIVQKILDECANKNHVALISKICCKFNETAFPISDSKVRNFLWKINKITHFYPNFRKSTLNKYDSFINVIEAFIKEYGLQKYKYRQLDLAIWTYEKLKGKGWA